MNESNKNNSRRKFITNSLLSVAGISSLSSFTFATSETDKNQMDIHQVRLGFIGVGRQAMGILNGMMKIPGVQVLACADVDADKRTRFQKRVARHIEENGKEQVEVNSYTNYNELLERKDIDAVVIATPDHWHCIQMVDACAAGKQVLVEKPASNSIAEAALMVKAAQKYGSIVQVNQWQRSQQHFADAYFAPV